MRNAKWEGKTKGDTKISRLVCEQALRLTEGKFGWLVAWLLAFPLRVTHTHYGVLAEGQKGHYNRFRLVFYLISSIGPTATSTLLSRRIRHRHRWPRLVGAPGDTFLFNRNVFGRSGKVGELSNFPDMICKRALSMQNNLALRICPQQFGAPLVSPSPICETAARLTDLAAFLSLITNDYVCNDRQVRGGTVRPISH